MGILGNLLIYLEMIDKFVSRYFLENPFLKKEKEKRHCSCTFVFSYFIKIV